MMDAALTEKLLRKEIKPADISDSTARIFLKRHNAVRSVPAENTVVFCCNAAVRNYKYVLGCNMAFWKKDLLKVNGYNESFKGWGKEDNELAVRLQNAGL